MNTDMWDHPLTARHLAVLGELGYVMIPPVEKKLACGVVGTQQGDSVAVQKALYSTC
jgi:phosphopantothenoylcysteine decarboxylase